MSDFSLLNEMQKSVAATTKAAKLLVANITQLSESAEIHPTFMIESALNVLANIVTKVANGEEIKAMHPNAVAAFLAGMEVISTALPKTTNAQKRDNTIRAMTMSGLGADGAINDATFPIVDLGSRKTDLHTTWAEKLKAAQSGDTEAFVMDVRKLQHAADAAMRVASKAV